MNTCIFLLLKSRLGSRLGTDVRFDVNLVGHMSDKKFLKWTVQTKLFFQKNRFLNKMISKNQVNKRNVFTGKNTLFLKSINNIL